jgi:methylenetetrahydrofolate reductase (NADPH)
MNFRDIYRNFSISFEVFPPKTEEGEKNLFTALGSLMRFSPAFISVTYGAGGSTREKTIDLAVRIRDTFRVQPLVHFTCVGSGRAEIAAYLDRVHSLGLTDILALRGDPPKGQTDFVPAPDGFSYASDLVSFIKKRGGFSIAVAGYPEGHPAAADFETDLVNLKRKIDAGAELVLTQLFFNPDDFFRLRDGLDKMGSDAIVIPGIMPITSASQLEGTIKNCVRTIPSGLAEKLGAAAPEDVPRIGIEHAIYQCEALIKGGAKGFHLYPLNKSDVVTEIINSLSLPGKTE